MFVELPPYSSTKGKVAFPSSPTCQMSLTGQSLRIGYPARALKHSPIIHNLPIGSHDKPAGVIQSLGQVAREITAYSSSLT